MVKCKPVHLYMGGVMEKSMTILSKVTADTDTSQFRRNDLLDELKGIRQIERRWIDFNNINADPANNISHRAGGNLLSNQNNIKDSLSLGIHTGQCLPVVELLKPPVHIQKNGRTIIFDYLLRDGYNRIAALKSLGYKGYVFDVFEFGTDGENYDIVCAKFSALSNRHYPSQASTDADMANMLRSLLGRKLVQDNLDTMKNWLVDNCGIRQNRATRIANSVLVENGNDDSILIYEPEQIKDVASGFGITTHGEYDYERGELGFHCRSSYERETYQNILRRLRLSKGKMYSYVTLCTKTLPKKNQTIEDQRLLSAESLKELELDNEFYAEWKKKNPGKSCWHIIGALPQKKSERDAGKIVEIK